MSPAPSHRSILEWYISPLCVHAVLIHEGSILHTWHTALENGDTESLYHAEMRTLRAIRDILASIDKKSLHTLHNRITYAGDWYFAQPHHKTIQHAVPQPLDIGELQKSIDIWKHEIASRQDRAPFHHVLLSEYRVFEYTSKGFVCDIQKPLYECTVHGYVGFVSGSFHVQVDRIMYLEGCIHDTEITSPVGYIPDFLQVDIEKYSTVSDTMIIIDVGMHTMNLFVFKKGIPYECSCTLGGYADRMDPSFKNRLVDDILSWCLDPSGTLEVIVMSLKEYDTEVRSFIGPVLEACHYAHIHYTIGVQYRSLDFSLSRDVSLLSLSSSREY